MKKDIVPQLIKLAEEELQKVEAKVARLLKVRQQLEGPRQSASSYELQDNRAETEFYRALILQYRRVIKDLKLREKRDGAVHVGSVVTVRYLDEVKEEEIVVVSQARGIKLGRISVVSTLSPLGRALVGRSVADELEIETPGGLVTARIVTVI